MILLQLKVATVNTAVWWVMPKLCRPKSTNVTESSSMSSRTSPRSSAGTVRGILSFKGTASCSAVDRHPFDADPDPNQNFHYDADPDLDPDRHQKRCVQYPYPDPTQNLNTCWKIGENIYFLYFYSQQCQFTMFFLSHKWKRCHNFKYFVQHVEMFWKKVKNTCASCLELIPIRIGRIRIGKPWITIPIRIRQNDADPSRSGYTSLVS